MKHITCYTHASRVGPVMIRQHGERWRIEIDGENLGSYHTARHALEDLIGGHCFWPASGDTSELGLPDDLTDWEAS